MSRISFHLDETKPCKPKIMLRCCGYEASMTEKELDSLIQEMIWLKNTLHVKRGNYYSNLAAKYKEVANVQD